MSSAYIHLSFLCRVCLGRRRICLSTIPYPLHCVFSSFLNTVPTSIFTSSPFMICVVFVSPSYPQSVLWLTDFPNSISSLCSTEISAVSTTSSFSRVWYMVSSPSFCGRWENNVDLEIHAKIKQFSDFHERFTGIQINQNLH